MAQQLLFLAIGAALVCLGVIAGALADRIRGNRTRERANSRTRRGDKSDAASGNLAATSTPLDKANRDIQRALVDLGYKDWIATEAVFRAREKLGAGADTQDVTREALRECPKVMAATS